ncbi:MAG: hypothetical protein IPH75_03815 [bacterium]|nr:hypothetical protein [bacterium]
MSKRITFTESDQHTTSMDAIVNGGSHQSAGKLPPTYSAIELIRLILNRRRFVVVVTVAVCILATGVLLLVPNKYQSEASLLPSGAQDKMADLKRLAGFGAMSLSDENSSELFPEILRSRSIQDSVLSKRYHFSHNNRPMTLLLSQYFDQENPDKLRGEIDDITYIALDKKTGVIDIAVETKYPDLSRQVLNSYLSELESFNLFARRSAARDNAQYLGKQIEKTRIEMAAAEDSLESYQASNRNWLEGSSPDLLKTIARLQREVEIQNKKYLYLTQEYEIAKLDAMKDVPIMRVLDEPSLPVEKASPKRGLLLVTIALVTALSTIFGVVAADIWRKRMATQADPELSGLSEDLRAAFPLVGNLLQPSGKASEVEEVNV